MRIKRANPKIFCQNNCFYLFNFIPIGDDGCSLNVLWSSFPDVCKSNYYAVYFKLGQVFVSIIYTRNWKKMQHTHTHTHLFLPLK